MRTLRWYTNRIGNTLYRKPLRAYGHQCECSMCTATEVHVHDEQHARYLKTCSEEEGIEYSDTPVL